MQPVSPLSRSAGHIRTTKLTEIKSVLRAVLKSSVGRDRFFGRIRNCQLDVNIDLIADSPARLRIPIWPQRHGETFYPGVSVAEDRILKNDRILVTERGVVSRNQRAPCASS